MLDPISNLWKAHRTPLILGIIVAVIAAIIVLPIEQVIKNAWEGLTSEEPPSVFRASTAVERCHNPPNVGKYVQTAINHDVIVGPGKAPDGAAGAPSQKAALHAVLCADSEIEGTMEEIFTKLEKEYSDCFDFRDSPREQKSFRLILESNYICVAEFEYVEKDREWVPEKSPDNPILCVPDVSFSSVEKRREDRIPVCPSEVLERFRWQEKLRRSPTQTTSPPSEHSKKINGQLP